MKFGISLTEPSTWISLISLLSLAGIQLAPEYSDLIVKSGVALGSILGVVFKWNSTGTKDEAKD